MNAPAHQFHQLLADTQAQTGAAVLRSGQGAHLGKRLEHPRLLLGADAWAAVLDAQVQVFAIGLIPLAGHAEVNPAPLGKLERIAQQVVHHLA